MKPRTSFNQAMRRIHGLLSAIVLIGTVFIGCGVKGPPVPPHQPPLPGVTDLAYQRVDGTVVLARGLDGPLTSRQAQEAAFVVYRSRSRLSDPACDTCPLIFDKVTTLPYADTPDRRFTAELPVERGYRYTFKVELESGSAIGKKTASVTFDLPAEGKKP